MEQLKVSIFTPTHNLTYLFDLYESIKDQPFYEWVIVANGLDTDLEYLYLNDPDWKASAFKDIAADPRVSIHWFTGNPYVGALKANACSYCTGDVYLEVDHDDIFMDNAIQKVIDVFMAHPEVGFVYSDCANFKGDFENVERYPESNGWTYYQIEYKGHVLDVPMSFDDHPAAVSKIWYAPNHLRAWRAEVYKHIGGHNPNMRVLDDQELLCRTAIYTEMYHIKECLYLYRVTGNNTWLIHNKEIQDNVLPIYNRYIHQIATVWAARNNLLALDFGGRFDKKPGILSVDLKDADVVCDLNESWPFEDNSVGLIVANDVIEHLKDKQFVMSEAHRVLAPGGMILIQVPSSPSKGAFQDPTHISYWNTNSFWYYTRREQSKFIDNDTIHFRESYLDTVFFSDWHKENDIPYAVAHLIAIKDYNRLSGRIVI
jgi:hypothetical protein